MRVVARSQSEPIYTLRAIADFLGVSVETLKNMRKQPEWGFIEVGSMCNTGGGRGVGAWSLPSSLVAAWSPWAEARSAETSRVRRIAGRKGGLMGR